MQESLRVPKNTCCTYTRIWTQSWLFQMKTQASLVMSCHYRFTSGDLNIDVSWIVMNTLSRQLPWPISSIRIMAQYKLLLLMISTDQQNLLNITFIYLRLSQWKEGFHHRIYSQSNSTSQMFQKIHIPEPLCRFLALYS